MVKREAWSHGTGNFLGGLLQVSPIITSRTQGAIPSATLCMSQTFSRSGVGTGVIEIGQDDQVHQPCFERLGLASRSLEDVESMLADRLAAVESLYG